MHGGAWVWSRTLRSQESSHTRRLLVFCESGTRNNHVTLLGLRNGRIIVLGDQSNDVGVSRTPTKTATPTPYPCTEVHGYGGVLSAATTPGFFVVRMEKTIT